MYSKSFEDCDTHEKRVSFLGVCLAPRGRARARDTPPPPQTKQNNQTKNKNKKTKAIGGKYSQEGRHGGHPQGGGGGGINIETAAEDLAAKHGAHEHHHLSAQEKNAIAQGEIEGCLGAGGVFCLCACAARARRARACAASPTPSTHTNKQKQKTKQRDVWHRLRQPRHQPEEGVLCVASYVGSALHAAAVPNTNTTPPPHRAPTTPHPTLTPPPPTPPSPPHPTPHPHTKTHLTKAVGGKYGGEVRKHEMAEEHGGDVHEVRVECVCGALCLPP